MLTIEDARRFLAQVVEEQGADFCYIPKGSTLSCHYVPLHVVEQWKADGVPFDGEWRATIPDYMVASIPNDHRRLTACIIGRVLALAGETRHQIPNALGKNVIGLSQMFPDMMEAQAARYLQAAQMLQDRGETWGNVLERVEVGYHVGEYTN